MPTLIKENWKVLLALSFLVVVVFSNALNNVFLSDDIAEIVNNPKIGNFSNIWSIPFGIVRPFLYFSAYQTDGLNPFTFRLISMLFHIGTVCLIFLLLKLMANKRIALFVSTLFAVHPALVEPVIWISAGGYVQYSFFFLLSLILYICSKNRKWVYLGSIFAYFLSLQSHPVMPILLPLVFFLYEFLFGDLKKSWAKLIPFFLLSTTWVTFNLFSLPEREQTLQTVNYQERGIDNIFVIIPIAISSYFELIFFPLTLTLYHSELAFGPVNFAVRAILTLLFLTTILYCFKKNKFIFFWLSLTLIALAPTLTPFRLNWIVAERYLYLPIIGVLVVVALGIDKLSRLKKFKTITFAFFGIVLILFSLRSIVRNIDWKNEDNLWIATGKTSPSSPNTHNNLGDVYGRWGDKQKSLQEFQTAIALKPNYADAIHNAGNVYKELGQTDQALEHYQKAASINPNLWQSYQNIAAIHFEKASQATGSAQLATQQYSLALENMQKAITISPNNINLYNNLGVIYLGMGNKQKAKEVFSAVLSADPKNQFAQQGLAEASK